MRVTFLMEMTIVRFIKLSLIKFEIINMILNIQSAESLVIRKRKIARVFDQNHSIKFCFINYLKYHASCIFYNVI